MVIKAGYKMTEVGVIPEDWDIKPMAAILKKGRLGGNYANQDAETKLPLMKMGNIGRGTFDLSKVQYIIQGVPTDQAHRLVYGDVLFNTRNTLDLVGKVAIWREEIPVAYYNSNLMRLEFELNEICSNDYANYSLNTESAISRLRGLATGTTSVAAIYTRDLLKLQMLVPPLIEQRAIANALSDIDALIAGLEKLIKKKRNIKQATMQQLLTGKTRLPGFSGEWVQNNLDELVELYQPKTISAYEFTESGFPVYGANGIVGNYHSVNHVQSQVIVTCRGSTCGTVNKTVGFCWITGNAMVLNCDENRFLNKDFFFYLMLIQDLTDCITGTGQPQIVRSPLASFKVKLPVELEEQTALAVIFQELDRELNIINLRLSKIRNIKQGMMQELLTGKTRLV